MNIEDLERRYQVLFSDFQAGKIDEATFIAQVDKLQFQDSWGRYWMIGAQSGAWHYYDGQNWHQADPRDGDKLPFRDEQGRYWQRGVKSGDWYYYQPDTDEWVKPDQGDVPLPPALQRRSERETLKSESVPYQSRLYQQSVETGPSMPAQFEGELFQDDEGRYWAIGSKTGQWYFFDHNGWHPAHEFQPSVAPQPSPQFYQTQTFPSPAYGSQPYSAPQPGPYQTPQDPWLSQPYSPPAYQPQGPQAPPSYAYQPQQPAYPSPAPAPQPAQPYAAPPAQEAQPQPAPSTGANPQAETAAQPTPPEPGQSGMPTPPKSDTQSGAWYYFDGKQWLKYSSGEPAETPPPEPKLVIDQEPGSAKVKVEAKSEPVVAELFEEDEPPVEVVDVEVITVIEAEPDEEPKVEKTPRGSTSSTPLTEADEIAPRRARQPSDTPRTRPAPSEPQQQPRERIPTDPGRPVAPRRREVTQEPTIIIPTGVAASGISSPSPAFAKTNRPPTGPVKPVQPSAHRAREHTVPMDTPAASAPAPTPAASQSPREVTQAMPAAGSKAARADTAQMRAQAAKPAASQAAVPASVAASQAVQTPAKKAGYTFGDVLRAFPSTFWTVAGGVVVLFIFAFIIIAAWTLLGNNNFGLGGVAVVQSPTPTLNAAPPDFTPTSGPTPTTTRESLTTPTPASVTAFSSSALGFTLEYPEDWQKKEGELQAIFSPSKDGLDPENLKDTAFWVGKPADKSSAISKLLTDVLSGFPANAKTLNEGTISIASQTWTSAQISFEDESMGGQGIATLAVTSKDGEGYYLVAAAPAATWNSMQPIFQRMINSFRFTTEEVIAAAPTTSRTTPPAASSSPAGTEEATTEADEAEATTEATPTTARPATPKATPTPPATATPLIYAVQSGDTLLEIALKFGVDVDLLASENDIDSPESLSIGQELIIPFTAEQLAAYNGTGSVAEASVSSEAEDTESPTTEAAAAEEASASLAEEETSEPAQTASTEAAPLSGRIVYAGFNPGTGVYDLWLADVATGEQTGIASGASQPAFNKDGSLLAYRSWNLDTRGIFFRDFVGGRGGRVTQFVEDGLPTWSPDGSTFAFASRREGDRLPRIFRGNQLGENDFSIGFQGEYPATFPDGRLVVRGCLPSGDCGLFIVGANGGGETKISSEPSDTAPAVSPDGRKIAFMSSGRGATNWEIWVMNADGSNPQRLTENGNNDGLPTWSPDGRSIAYVSDSGGVWAVWAMNADGSNQRKLFNMKGSPDGSVLHDKDNSRGWLEERISWAP